MNNLFLLTMNDVDNAKNTIRVLKAKAMHTPLSDAELKEGRRSALIIGAYNKSKTRQSSYRLHKTMMKFYMERGYTEQEASEALRAENINNMVSMGLGTSKRCGFVSPH